MLTLSLIAAATILTSGCDKTPPPEVSLDPRVCESWQRIRPSRKDMLTPGTAEQIVGNNVAREAWCSQPPKFASARVRA